MWIRKCKEGMNKQEGLMMCDEASGPWSNMAGH